MSRIKTPAGLRLGRLWPWKALPGVLAELHGHPQHGDFSPEKTIPLYPRSQLQVDSTRGGRMLFIDVFRAFRYMAL